VVDLQSSQLTAQVLGILPLPVGDITDALVDTTLNPVLETIVPPLLRALGVDVGIADVSVPLATCQSAALVA